MPRRTRWLGRAVVVAVVGVAFGFCGAVGESVAQDNMKKDDTMKAGDTMKKGEYEVGRHEVGRYEEGRKGHDEGR